VHDRNERPIQDLTGEGEDDHQYTGDDMNRLAAALVAQGLRSYGEVGELGDAMYGLSRGGPLIISKILFADRGMILPRPCLAKRG